MRHDHDEASFITNNQLFYSRSVRSASETNRRPIWHLLVNVRVLPGPQVNQVADELTIVMGHMLASSVQSLVTVLPAASAPPSSTARQDTASSRDPSTPRDNDDDALEGSALEINKSQVHERHPVMRGNVQDLQEAMSKTCRKRSNKGRKGQTRSDCKQAAMTKFDHTDGRPLRGQLLLPTPAW